MKPVIKLIFILLFSTVQLFAQQTARSTDNELKMTFPSIYFKHNSSDYAVMPYSVDSCFKYIAANIKDLNSYPIWRDSAEKERLSYVRMQKLKTDLKKYIPGKKITFQSMGTAQKISRHTIEKSDDETQKQYLLTLNSVLDVSGVIENKKVVTKEKKQRKRLPRLVWCGWKYGFHWSSNGSSTKKTKSKN